MSITLERLQELRKQLERATRERDRAQGALEQVLSRLKKEFEVDSIEQGQKLLERLKREDGELKAKLQEELDRIDNDFPELE